MTEAVLQRKNLLRGFYKTLFTLAVPIILQNLMQNFVNMLDTIMVGRLGSVEIAAVGLGNQIFFMLSMVSFGISSGCSIFVSQYWGKGSLKGIRQSTGIMLAACAAFSVLFFVGGFFFPEFLLGLYSTDPAVIAKGVPYLKIVAFSYPLTAVSFAFQMAFRSTEHVYLPMACTGISLVLNLIFNTAFIFGVNVPLGSVSISIPAMGVSGAALATLCCRTVEFLIVVIYSYAKKFEVCGSVAELLGFDSPFVKKVFKTAFPVLVSESLWGLGISMQNMIFGRSGTDSIAAFNITNTLSQLIWVVCIGMGNAAAIILGKKIGAGEIDSAKAYVHRFSWFMPVAGGIVGLLLFPLGQCLGIFFNVSPVVIHIAQTMILVLMCFYPLQSFNMVLIVGICRAGGDTLFSMLIDNGFMWFVSIPLGFVAAFVWKLPPFAIFAILESEQILKLICGAIRVKSGKWLHNLVGEKA